MKIKSNSNYTNDNYKDSANDNAKANPGKTHWDIKFTWRSLLWVINTVPIAGQRIPEKIVIKSGNNHQIEFIKDIIQMISYDLN